MLEQQYHHFHAMGSPCSFHFYANSEDDRAITTLLTGEVRRLEEKYSRYSPTSFTSKINQAAVKGAAIDIDPETAALLDYSNVAWEQSDGLFDITSGVLRKAWNFKQQKLPSNEQLDRLLPFVGWDKLIWDKPRLHFTTPGIEIDFGGLVKEYAADCVAALAHAQGIKHGLVELGGDIRVIGPHPDGRPWAVGIRHPRVAEKVLATIDCSSGAIASSGDYERCIVVNNKRYGHVLNPTTGWPVNGLICVTVAAEHCLLAGTTTTLALLKGEQGPSWLDEQAVPWIAVNEKLETLGSIVSAN